MGKKRIFLRVIFITLIIISIIISITILSIQTQQKSEERTYNILSETALQYNELFRSKIDSKLQIVQTVSNGIAYDDDDSDETIIKKLQNGAKTGAFSRMLFARTDGTSISNIGEKENISHRSYFTEAISGKTVVSDPVFTEPSKNQVIVLAVPVVRNGEVIGIVCGGCHIEDAKNVFFTTYYYGECYVFISGNDGEIIMHSETKDRLSDVNNTFDFFSKAKMKNNFTTEKLKKAVLNGENGCFEINFEGKNRFVSFAPIGINDWYSYCFSTNNLIISEMDNIKLILIQFIIEIAFVFLVILVYIIFEKRHDNKMVVEANKQYENLISNIVGGVITFSYENSILDTDVKYVSPGFTDLTGYTLNDIAKNFGGKYKNLICSADMELLNRQLYTQTEAGAGYELHYRIRKKDGSYVWVMDNSILISKLGNKKINQSIITDISLLKQQERKLLLSEERFRITAKALNGCIFEFDFASKIHTFFKNADLIFGISDEEMIEQTKDLKAEGWDSALSNIVAFFYHQDDQQMVWGFLENLFENKDITFEARVRQSNGKHIWCSVYIALLGEKNNIPERIIGRFTDIDEMKRKASIDGLTNVYNKATTTSLSEKSFLENIKRLNAAIMLDIDDFKGINDLFGHTFGDAVLVYVSGKLKKLFKDCGILGRVGGDEFFVFLPHIKDEEFIIEKAKEISGIFKESYTVGNAQHKISCSVGIAFSNSKSSFYELYKEADSAMYKAKNSGKNYFHIYDCDEQPELLSEELRANTSIVSDINLEIKSRIFDLLYSVADLETGINMVLKLLAQYFEVSRIYIFEIIEENPNYIRNTFEWCNEPLSTLNERFKKFNVKDPIDYFSLFDDRGVMHYEDTEYALDILKEICTKSGIKSILNVKMVENGQLKGFIGFDKYNGLIKRSEEELDLLIFVSKILSTFIFKKRADEKIEKLKECIE